MRKLLALAATLTAVTVPFGNQPAATVSRYELLTELQNLLTRYFDIRELAGQAERRSK